MHEMTLRDGLRSTPNGVLREDLLKPRLRDQTPGITDSFREVFRECVTADASQRPSAPVLYDTLLDVYNDLTSVV